MDDTTLMSEGLTLMLTGMGFVFVFLTVLVLVTTLMSWVITQPSQQDHTLLTVLSSAVHKYRNKKNK